MLKLLQQIIYYADSSCESLTNKIDEQDLAQHKYD